MEFNEDIASCADLVRRGDPDRFLAIMSAPVKKRGALFIIYAFNLEVVRAPWVTQEPMISEMRLQWWLDSIEEIYEGKTIRRHEVVTPLAELIRIQDLPRDLFDTLIKARRWDIYKEPHAHAYAFEDYIMSTSGNLIALACLSIGMPSSDIKNAKEYGFGDGIARLFVAIPTLKSMQRYPLLDGSAEAISALANSSLIRMNNVLFSDSSGTFALRTAWLAKKTLRLVAKEPMQVVNGISSPTEFYKKILLLAKTFSKTF